jgi:hypothetical protein
MKGRMQFPTRCGFLLIVGVRAGGLLFAVEIVIAAEGLAQRGRRLALSCTNPKS